MGVIVDLIIIAIVALSTYLAYKKGLVALAIKLCAVVISIVITLLLYKPVSNLIINTTSIDETIQNFAKDGVLDVKARELSIQIVNTGVIIILFLIIKFLLRFVTVIANKIAKLPIINQFNKAGGLIYGLLRGIIIVYIALLLIGFAGQINQNNKLHKSINESTLGKMMYENNVLNMLF